MKASNNFLCLKVQKELGEGFGTFKTTQENQLMEGEVVSLGEKASAEFKPRQKVIFDKLKTMEYVQKGQKYYFVKDETILGIL